MSGTPDPQTMSNADLKAAYEASGGQAGDPHEDALADEIQQRNLDL